MALLKPEVVKWIKNTWTFSIQDLSAVNIKSKTLFIINSNMEMQYILNIKKLSNQIYKSSKIKRI